MIGEQHDSNTISSTFSTNITATVERMTKSVLRADTIHKTPATRMRAHVNNSEVTAKQVIHTRVAMHAFRGYASLSSCSVLQCVAVCCSVLRCVNTEACRGRALSSSCSVLQCVAVCCNVPQCVAVCCSVLQCVAGRCRVLQCVAVCQSRGALA